MVIYYLTICYLKAFKINKLQVVKINYLLTI